MPVSNRRDISVRLVCRQLHICQPESLQRRGVSEAITVCTGPATMSAGRDLTLPSSNLSLRRSPCILTPNYPLLLVQFCTPLLRLTPDDGLRSSNGSARGAQRIIARGTKTMSASSNLGTSLNSSADKTARTTSVCWRSLTTRKFQEKSPLHPAATTAAWPQVAIEVWFWSDVMILSGELGTKSRSCRPSAAIATQI